MKITVKLFAMLDRYAPDQQKAGEPFSVDIPKGSTIDDLIAYLGIPERKVKVTFVDARARAGAFQLNPDAEVGVFPPVGGG